MTCYRVSPMVSEQKHKIQGDTFAIITSTKIYVFKLC